MKVQVRYKRGGKVKDMDRRNADILFKLGHVEYVEQGRKPDAPITLTVPIATDPTPQPPIEKTETSTDNPPGEMKNDNEEPTQPEKPALETKNLNAHNGDGTAEIPRKRGRPANKNKNKYQTKVMTAGE